MFVVDDDEQFVELDAVAGLRPYEPPSAADDDPIEGPGIDDEG